MSTPVPRRPMTADEIMAYQGLCHVTFPVASWDKRFFRHLGELSLSISEKEIPQLWRLFMRYRRQILASDSNAKAEKNRLLRMAETRAAPDFRKQQKALNEQARIDEMKKKYGEAFAKEFGT